MNANNLFELICQEILAVINPCFEDCTKRLEVIDQIRAAVSTVGSLRGATVEPFGSFLSHLFTRWGDLDISIELSNGTHIVYPGRKHKQNLLGEVIKALKATGVQRLEYIPKAKVPILKFTSYQNISCDISISNLLGQMKSKFLLWISVIDYRFRSMVLLVKEWAKANNINDPKDRTFNSYSLCLLIIFHFQTCEPAIFPPLNEIYPTNMAEELGGVRSDVEEHFEQVCNANINKFRNTKRSINRSSLSELFVSFLAKFSDISIRAKDQGICTFTGTWEHIGWLSQTYALLIKDPLEQPANSASTVSGGQLYRISEAFYTSYEVLTSPNQSRASIIQTMVLPHIWRSLLPRPVEAYPSSGYPPTRMIAPPISVAPSNNVNSEVTRQPNPNDHYWSFGGKGTYNVSSNGQTVADDNAGQASAPSSVDGHIVANDEADQASTPQMWV